MAKPPAPSIDVQALADKAVLGVCEVLALLFVLPFGEDLYNDKQITALHLFYSVIGLVFAGVGPIFPWIRTRRWIPENVSASLSRAALDARIWIVTLLLIFIYGTGPEIYRRAVQPTTPQVRVPPSLTARLWSPLTDDQESSLERALRAISKRAPLQIICMSTDCRELAGNFISAFNSSGWQVRAAFSGYPSEPVGLVLFQTDINDHSLADTIETTTRLKIQRIEPSAMPTGNSLFIGIKP
jgi:hypothetical protein